jgi:hypothetical protein
MSVAPVQQQMGVPAELIKVHAYYKWRWRCRSAGREVHGNDKEDWFQSQYELIRIFSHLDFEHLSQIVSRVADAAGRDSSSPDQDSIRSRAFYKSLSRKKAGKPEHPAEDWAEAEKEERFARFARLFLVKLSELNTDETLKLRQLFLEYPRLYNPDEPLE